MLMCRSEVEGMRPADGVLEEELVGMGGKVQFQEEENGLHLYFVQY